MEEDKDVPLILGRLFLETGSALIDFQKRQLILRLSKKHISFNVFEDMKFPTKSDSCFSDWCNWKTWFTIHFYFTTHQMHSRRVLHILNKHVLVLLRLRPVQCSWSPIHLTHANSANCTLRSLEHNPESHYNPFSSHLNWNLSNCHLILDMLTWGSHIHFQWLFWT